MSAGLAATDRRLVPYGALIATFHTGVGCLLGPSAAVLRDDARWSAAEAATQMRSPGLRVSAFV